MLHPFLLKESLNGFKMLLNLTVSEFIYFCDQTVQKVTIVRDYDKSPVKS